MVAMPFSLFRRNRKAASTSPNLWFIVALATVAQIGDGIVTQGIPVLYPFIQNELSLTRAQVGLITSGMMAGSMFTVFLGGWLADVWGVKRVLVLVLIYTSVPVFVFSFIGSLWAAIAVGILIGLGMGPVYPASSRAIMDWLPVRIRGFGMSVKQAAPALAGAASAVTLPFIAVNAGWPVAIRVLASLTLLTGIVFLIFYKERPGKASVTHRPFLSGFSDLFHDRGLIAATVWGVVIVGLQFLVLTYLILFFVERVGFSMVTAGGYLGMALFASTAARVLWGAVSDFLLGSRRVLTLGVMSLVGVLALTGITFMGPSTPTAVIVLVSVGLGVSILSWPGIFTVYVAELAGTERSGASIGAVNTIMRLGIVTAPPLFGLLVDVTDSYALGWAIAAGALVLSTVSLLVFGKEPPRQPS
jgi:MFS family permease